MRTNRHSIHQRSHRQGVNRLAHRATSGWFRKSESPDFSNIKSLKARWRLSKLLTANILAYKEKIFNSELCVLCPLVTYHKADLYL